MRLWLKILLGSLCGLVVVITAALVLLTQTALGVRLADNISRPIIEDVVREQLGSEVSYEPLAGRLPNLLVLQGLEMSQDGEVWATVDRAVLRWDAKDLIRWNIHVREIVLADVDLHRIPVLPEQPPKVEDDQPAEVSEESPKTSKLPVIRVDTAVINSFTLGEDVLGAAYTVSLAGEVRLADRRLRTDVILRTERQTDILNISAMLSDDHIDFDLAFVGEDDGLVAGLASTGGRVELRAVAEGPPEAMDAQLLGDFAAYGQLAGTLGVSATTPDRLSAELRYTPGSIIPDDVRGLTGDEVSLVGEGQFRNSKLTVALERLAGGFGFIGGDIAAEFGDALTLTTTLQGNVAETALEPYGATDFAGNVSLTLDAQKVDQDTDFNTTLSAAGIRVQITDGANTPSVPFSGTVTVNAAGLAMDTGPLKPLFDEKAEAVANVRFSSDEKLTVPDFRVQIGSTEGGRLIASGTASVDLAAESLSADIRASAGEQTLALLTDQVAFEAPLTLDVKSSGSFESLRVNATAAIPRGNAQGTTFSDGALAVILSGLPTAPTGTINLVANDDAYRGNVQVRTEGTETRAENLSVRLGNLNINGGGAFDREGLFGQLSLVIDAMRGVNVAGGNRASGALQIDASAEPENGPVALTVEGRDLRFGSEEVERLSITAGGPRDAIDFDVLTEDLYAAGTSIPRFESQGTLGLRQTLVISLKTLMAALNIDGSQTIKLAEPTTITFGDAITLDPTKIDVFGEGSIETSATISPQRWLANVSATNLPLPIEDATSSLNLALDTDQTTAGQLNFRLDAERDDGTYSIDGEGVWDGRLARSTIRLISPGTDDEGVLQGQLPVVLTRGERLGVAVDDTGFKGRFDYEGALAALLTLAPVDQQLASGDVVAHVSTEGSFSALQTQGSVTLKDARVESSNIGLVIDAINGGISFSVAPDGTRGKVDITATGTEGRPQSIKLFGGIDRQDSESSIDLQFTTDRAQLAKSSELEVRLTSDLTLKGSFDEMTLAGPVVINELDITVPDIEGGENAPKLTPVNIVRVDAPTADEVMLPEEEPAAPPPVIVNLDLSVNAGNGIFVRGRGLTAEWEADLIVRGRADAPTVIGDVVLERGEIDLAGRIFDLTTGDVSFSESAGLNPFVDVEAQTETGEGSDSVTAILSVEGPADDLEFSFTSQPVRPEEDVIALILFGRPANELGAAEAIQLAQAVATLTGAGPFGGTFAGGIRSGLGLDRLSYDPSGNALTVGKYISEDVYVSARQSFGDIGTVVSVIYEVSRFFNIETTLQPDGAQKLGANYKRDY